MKIWFHQNFKKSYQKLASSEKDKFKERIRIFLEDEFSPRLNNHALRGKYRGYRSLNITGDLKMIYKRLNKEQALFITIGKHSHLYK